MLLHLLGTEELRSQRQLITGIGHGRRLSAQASGQLTPACKNICAAHLQIRDSLRSRSRRWSAGYRQRTGPSRTVLANEGTEAGTRRRSCLDRMMHDDFCCNRRSVAATDLRPADSPLTRSPHCASGPVVLGLRTPGAVPLSDFSADRHESCGPRNLQANDDCAIDNSDTSMRAVTRIERSDRRRAGCCPTLVLLGR